MEKMDEQINTFDALKSFLARAYWIETIAEQTAQWYGYLKVKTDIAKETLFELTIDSDNHKTTILELIRNIKGFDLAETLNELNLDKPQVDFNGKVDEEIFQTILENEHAAFDLFTKIYHNTDPQLIKEVWRGDDDEEFFNTFSWLMLQEKDHIELIEPLSLGQIERIM